MRHLLTILVLLLFTLSSTAKNPVQLHTIEQMNLTPHQPGSHVGQERYSRLESVGGSVQLLPGEMLGTEGTAIYPRIKKMADGRYILFCQGGQIASRIYYYLSDDLLHWSEGKELFSPYAVATSVGDDVRCFSTADAVVLDNGDILAVCSYRASVGYKNNIGCGLMLRRSRDNGATWSEERSIFEGANWEPYLLQLPDGRIQCYFTDCLPKTRNSGTSVMTSTDGGETWHDYMRVCRQYKYDDNGVAIFTDQMPSFRLLADGKTLLGFMEARLEPDGPRGKSKYMMSLVRNHGFDWRQLGETGAGPDDRDTNLFEGCAGYVTVFPSGETLISCNIDRIFSLKIGDAAGRTFNGRSWTEDWFRPFTGQGFWGSTEQIDPHRVIGAMHCNEGVQVGIFYLNHSINAPRVQVRADGDGKDWSGDEALFIGGDGQANAVLRACHDDRYLYLLAECRDSLPDAKSGIEMQVCRTGAHVQDAVCIEVSTDGVNATIGGESLRGIRGKCRNAVSISGEKGYVAEVAIPLSAMQAEEGDTLCFNAVVKSDGVRDTFTFATEGEPSTWMPVILK